MYFLLCAQFFFFSFIFLHKIFCFGCCLMMKRNFLYVRKAKKKAKRAQRQKLSYTYILCEKEEKCQKKWEEWNEKSKEFSFSILHNDFLFRPIKLLVFSSQIFVVQFFLFYFLLLLFAFEWSVHSYSNHRAEERYVLYIYSLIHNGVSENVNCIIHSCICYVTEATLLYGRKNFKTIFTLNLHSIIFASYVDANMNIHSTRSILGIYLHT